MKFPIALQPFTIREEMGQDYFGAFAKVAEIGYQGVEIGPPPEGITVEVMKERFTAMGLHVIGCHASLEQVTDGLDALIDYLHELGGSYVVLSHRFESKQEVLDAAKLFNQIGANCRERNVQFLYHNHDWEFVTFDGQYAMDILLEETDPELVQMELDIYWVKKGGEDPVAYLRKLKDRCPLLHIKDMEPGAEQFFAEVGEGIMKWDEILEAAAHVGAKWLVVEQDHSRRNPMESIAMSYRNLQGMGVV